MKVSKSVIYYSTKNFPLGLAFYSEVENAINKIAKNPTLLRIIEEDVRRCLTKRFPYGILYTIEENYILIRQLKLEKISEKMEKKQTFLSF